MINVVIPITENVEEYSEFIKKENTKDVKFFVGIKESLLKDFSIKGKNIEVHTFADKSKKEEIINSLQSCNFDRGKIIIIRRPLLDEEFKLLVKSQKDISKLSSRQSTFKLKMKKMIMWILRRIFAFTYFDDISAICYGETMFDLMSVCANFSMASRINKYTGVEIEEIMTEQKSVGKEYNKTKAILMFILWSIFMVGSIVGGTLICVFTPLRALIVVVVLCWIILAVILWLVALVNFMRKINVGDLHYGRAEEILN